jgi:hypothetical protein
MFFVYFEADDTFRGYCTLNVNEQPRSILRHTTKLAAGALVFNHVLQSANEYGAKLPTTKSGEEEGGR